MENKENLLQNEQMPFGFRYYMDIAHINTIKKSNFNVVECSDFNTTNYVAYGFYRPISKLMNTDNLNNVF